MFSYSRQGSSDSVLACDDGTQGQEAGSKNQRSWTEVSAVQAQRPSPWLHEISKTFQHGFVCGLKDKPITLAFAAKQAAEPCLVGVFLEGAAMACALLDAWMPWKKNRWRALLEATGDRHVYELHAGLGMALARANQNLESRLHELDPLLRWLVVDGFGFHHGFFDAVKHIHHKELPGERIGKGHHRKVFDQGLGRSVWFACEADIEAVIATIRGFPAGRQRELWTGIGVAATLAGGVDPRELSRLLHASGRHRQHLAQGAAFAAHVRQRGLTYTDHTDKACEILCGVSVAEASAVVEKAFRTVAGGGPRHLHESWQNNVRKTVSRGLATR